MLAFKGNFNMLEVGWRIPFPDRRRVGSMRKVAATFVVCFFMCQFLSAGFPKGDLLPDGRIDLRDAILSVKGLYSVSQASDATVRKGDLGIRLEPVVEAFKILAEVKSFIPEKEKNSISSSYTLLALLSDVSYHFYFPGNPIQQNDTLHYQSIELDVLKPPPLLS